MDETNTTRRIALGESREGISKIAAVVGWEIIQEQFPFQRTKAWFPRGGRFFPSSHPVLVVTQEVLASVNEHVAETLEREVGGFLVGNRYFCPVENREYVLVDNFWRARFTSGDSVSLDLTADAWADFNDQLTTKFRGKLLIGWYHSHPRMEVFLSNDDLRIHESRFGEPWMVALVIEPAKNLGGFFGWRNGRVHPNQPIEFFEYFGHRSERSVVSWGNYFGDGAELAVARQDASAQKSSRKSRRSAKARIAATVCLLMILAVVLLSIYAGGDRIARAVNSLYQRLRPSEELPLPDAPAFTVPVMMAEPRPSSEPPAVVEESHTGEPSKPDSSKPMSEKNRAAPKADGKASEMQATEPERKSEPGMRAEAKDEIPLPPPPAPTPAKAPAGKSESTEAPKESGAKGEKP
jgi:proteasome lid subunit RPN8/RPN11